MDVAAKCAPVPLREALVLPPFRDIDSITVTCDCPRRNGGPVGTLSGKVAFITGAARGQGRSHAIRLAHDGADIIAVDICAQIDSVPYPMPTPEDLAQTVKKVEALGRRVYAVPADVRDEVALASAFAHGVSLLGPAQIVVANAGIASLALAETHAAWQDTPDVNLTGTFNTIEAAIPSMIEHGTGGSIVLTGSTASVLGFLGSSRAGLAYTASKHGVLGLMRSYANNLAQHDIRVNCVLPTGVNTPMVDNDPVRKRLAVAPSVALTNALPVQLVEPDDIAKCDCMAGLGRGPLRHGHCAPSRRRICKQEVAVSLDDT